MGVVFMDTADINDTGFTRWTGTAHASISTTQKRTGTCSYRLRYTSGGEPYMYVTVPTASTYYVKCGVYIVEGTFSIRFRETSTVHVGVVFDVANGLISTWRNTVLLDITTVPQINPNTWYCLEVYCIVNDSTGVIQVKLNGVEVTEIAFSGDTRNGGTGVVNNIMFICDDYTEGVYLDDPEIRDDAWPGTGGIYVLSVADDGSDTGWTASAGDRHECVAEIPPTFTNYIQTDAGTPNTLNSFTLDATDLPGNYESIPAVGVIAYAQLDTAGLGSIRAYADSDGDHSNGSPVALDVSGLWVTHYMTVDPHTSAAFASKAAVTGLEIGVETQ